MLKTSRLILREFKPTQQDYQGIFSIMSDEVVNKYLPWYPLKSINGAKEFYNKRILPKYEKKSGYYFAVCMKEDNIPIGYVSVGGESSHDLGYGLKKAYWNKGVMTEACNRVIRLLESKDWKYITATHDVLNGASGKVMQKLGMEYKYSYEEQWQPKNNTVTFRMYQLNLDGDGKRVYKEYWDKHAVHFIEDI